MSEAGMTTSEDLNGGNVIERDMPPPPPAVPPELQADPAVPQAPVDTPNPDPVSPTETMLLERMAKLETALETLEDAWLHFSLSASKAIEEVKKAPAVEGHNMLHDLIKAIHDRVTRIEARFL